MADLRVFGPNSKNSKCHKDGSTQRSHEGYKKSDGSSPTARTDSIIMTWVVDAREGRNISIIDVENVFFAAILLVQTYI